MELIHVSGNTDCLLGKTAVGIYRIDDTRCILFDNGYSKEYDELVGSLKDAGLTPAGLIVSHAHIDHHGNSKRLREAFQIPLAMSLGEAGLIASQAALERYTNSGAPRRKRFPSTPSSAARLTVSSSRRILP